MVHGLTNSALKDKDVYKRIVGVTYGIPNTDNLEVAPLGAKIAEALSKNVGNTQKGLELLKRVIRKAKRRL